MRVRMWALCSWAMLVAVIFGCQRDPIGEVDPLASLDTAEEFTVFSIDGRDFEPGQKPLTEETFHGYPVLGKVMITDIARRKVLIAALDKGMKSKDARGAKCFWPRHGIRATTEGKTKDVVICFECGYVDIYEGSTKIVKHTTSGPKKVFNDSLQEAGIPIAPFGRDKDGPVIDSVIRP